MSHFKIFTIVLLTLNVVNCNLPDLVRHVTGERAPGCIDNKTCSRINVFYVKAVGPDDTLHYIWDFTAKPSLLIALTNLNSSLTIDWKSFFKNSQDSVQITPTPRYSYIVVLNEFMEFDDVDDTGFITKDSRNASYDLSSFDWQLTPHSSLGDGELELVGKQSNDQNHILNGSISVQLTTFKKEGHDSVLPRLLHSSNSSQIRILLQNLTSDSNFTHGRWALGLVIIASDYCNKTLSVDMAKSLDDENSPGVFSVYNLLTPVCSGISEDRGFLHWRPVTYTSREPSLSNSSNVGVLEPTLVKYPLPLLIDTLAVKFYGFGLSHNHLIERTYISFGSAQDGFYKKTNFTSWAFLISYGTPQAEGFSMIVYLVLGIGLGLPAFLTLVGGIVVCARRFARRRDELSLER